MPYQARPLTWNLTERYQSGACPLLTTIKTPCPGTQPYARGVSEGCVSLKSKAIPSLSPPINPLILFLRLSKIGLARPFCLYFGGDKLAAKTWPVPLLTRLWSIMALASSKLYDWWFKTKFLAGKKRGAWIRLGYHMAITMDRIFGLSPGQTFDDFATLTEFLGHAQV